MNISPRKTFCLPMFAVLSLLLHGIASYTLARFGSYDFSRPVSYPSSVVVELEPSEKVQPNRDKPKSAVSCNSTNSPLRLHLSDPEAEGGLGSIRDPDDNKGGGRTVGATADAEMANPEKLVVAEDAGDDGGAEREINGTAGAGETTESRSSGVLQQPGKDGPVQPVQKFAQLLTTTREKLSYQLSLFGVPVGSAVLEAVGGENEIRITMSAQSNAVVASFYSVADSAETRLIGGKYIVSNFRQQEGGFRSDTGFTLCLPQRSVLWTDRVTKAVRSYVLEEDAVWDVISGFYFLRKQPLEVGKTVHLHIFANQKTIDAPVEVLRRERVRLPGFREADALVVRPELPTDGLFRRSGELLVWITDDQNRVPVRMETVVPLGRVTAELISAEAEHMERGAAHARDGDLGN